jgi:hypothetical protein
MMVSMKRPASVAMLIVAVAAVCALLLAAPGQTVTTRYLNDLFIFLDGVHRVSEGQVPNRDFHTALGPLVYYTPALGYWISGHLGGAMPVGMALLILVLAPVAAHILSSRLRPAIALPLAAFLILVAAAPLNPGETLEALSFAMFYNRIGWSALGVLLILHVQPTQPHRHQKTLDGLCATVLILIMLYIKASYGIVGLGFLVLMLLDPHQRRWAAASLCLVLASGLLIEAFWGGTAAHVGDLLLASKVSGGLKSLDELTSLLFRSLADYTLFVIFAAFALRQTRSIRDCLFFGFCAGSGLLLIMQNYQFWGIITLPAGAAVAAEILARRDGHANDGPRFPLAAGTQILLLAFVLPSGLQNAAALGLHAGLASLHQGQAVPLPGFDRVRLAHLWNDGDYRLFSRYLTSLADGAKALASLDRRAERVHVLDFVGPFSAGLSLAPPRGDSTWHHWNRTMDERQHLPPEVLLQDVQIVMEPKWPIDAATAEGLRRIYADYVAERFQLKEETADWKVYVVRQPAETVSRSLGSDPGDTMDEKPPDGG